MLKSFYKNIIFKYPKAVLVLIALLTLFLGYHATNLKVDASSETLLLEDDKDLAYTVVVNQRYRSPDFLVVAYNPKKDLLAKETLDEIKELTDDLTALSLVKSTTSVLNIPFLQSPPRPVSELVEHVPTIASGDVDLKLAKLELLNSPLYFENLVSADFKTTAILINMYYNEKYYTLLDKRNALRKTAKDTLEYKKVQAEFKAYHEKSMLAQHENIIKIRSILEQHRDKADMFLGGVSMIADDMITYVKNDLKTYGGIVLLLLIATLYFLFRQKRWVFVPILILAVSITSSIGLLGLFSWEITVISSNYVSLQLILTTSIIIHLIVRYRELASKFPSQNQEDLVLHTVLSMFQPTFFAVLTTIAGFGSLILSGILPVISLGWMMSAGLIISFVLTYLLFPSILVLMKPSIPKKENPKDFSITKVFAKLVDKNAKAIYFSSLMLMIFAIYGASNLRVENSFIDYFKKSTEIYQGMSVIDHQLGGTTPLDITIDFPRDEEVAVVEEKSEDEEDEFFDEFEDEFEANKNDDSYWFTSDKMDKIKEIHTYLESIPELGKVLSFGTMLEVGRNINEGEDLDNFELGLLYKELPDEFADLIVKPYLNIDSNQVRFSIRIVDSNPALRRDALLKKIESDLHTKLHIPKENIHLSGIMVLFNNMLQSLFSSQILTLGAMVVLLFVMFLILFKSFKTAVVAMMANLIPISVIFGFMGWLDIPLDMMTITIASISIGIAVDDTIHYLYRFQKEFNRTKNYELSMYATHTSVGNAMSYTSAAIAIGFLVLVLSVFIPTIYFGLLTVLAMVMALLADLLLLPKLIMQFKVFGQER